MDISLTELIKRFRNKDMLKAPGVKDSAQTALIGAMIIFVGLFFSTGLFGSYSKTEARVTRIEYTAEDKSETSEMRVYVSYAAEGKEYEDIRCRNYDSDIRVGDIVEIEYKNGEASEIRTFSDLFMVYAIFVGGGAAFAFGMYMTAQALSKLDPNEFEEKREPDE